MLRKLYKHDMHALSRIMLFVFLGIFCMAAAISVFGAVQMRQNYSYILQEPIEAITQAISISVIAFGVIGIIAGAVVITVFLYVHFYRNLFSDEGYLTHTLPVKSRQILLSKVLSAATWQLASAIVIMLSVLIIALCTSSRTTLFNTEVFLDIWEGIIGMGENGTIGTTLLAVSGFLAMAFSSMMQVFLAITIGCAIAKKHRIWAAIGIYLAINFCSGILNSMVGGSSLLIMMVTMENTNSIFGSVNVILLLRLIKDCGIAVVCFFWSNHLMKRRLNLQ